MKQLYPLKFTPLYFDKIWGGDRIKTFLKKDTDPITRCGESWEISAVEGLTSVVSNGFLKDNTLTELVEVYMGDLVGEKIYDKFGVEFPLLLKFIDAGDDLSVQVHPGDELAKERHNAYGKTEMWYILHTEEGAKINAGFNQPVTRDLYLKYLEEGRIEELLRFEDVEAGDLFFIPAGRVHSIGKGVLLAEIQQTSDITYRIFDYNRTDKDGNPRELHTDLALDAIKFDYSESYKTDYTAEVNSPAELVSCPWFTVNLLRFSGREEKNYSMLDSFIIYMCIKGAVNIKYENGTETLQMGETILIPANLELFTLIPVNDTAEVLEVYIK